MGKLIGRNIRGQKRQAPPHKKWDWELAYALYLNGMQSKDILALKEFEGLSVIYFNQKIYKEGWTKRRDDFLLSKGAMLSRTLQDVRKSAIEEHYKFLLREIDLEREVIKNRIRTGKPGEQSQRLSILQDYCKIAEKALGIENEKPGDVAKEGMKWLIAVQVNPTMSLPAKGQGRLIDGNKIVTAEISPVVDSPVVDGEVDPVVDGEGADPAAGLWRDEREGGYENRRASNASHRATPDASPESILALYRAGSEPEEDPEPDQEEPGQPEPGKITRLPMPLAKAKS